MANTTKWSTPTDRGSVLTTELNSLANGSYSAVGSEVDNATNKDLYGDFELNVTFGSAPSAGGYIGLYLIPALDGTNYADGGSSVAPPATSWIGNFPLRAVTTAQRVTITGVSLPPSKFKVVAYNGSGQAFPSSGSTVDLYTSNVEVE